MATLKLYRVQEVETQFIMFKLKVQVLTVWLQLCLHEAAVEAAADCVNTVRVMIKSTNHVRVHVAGNGAQTGYNFN